MPPLCSVSHYIVAVAEINCQDHRERSLLDGRVRRSAGGDSWCLEYGDFAVCLAASETMTFECILRQIELPLGFALDFDADLLGAGVFVGTTFVPPGQEIGMLPVVAIG